MEPLKQKGNEAFKKGQFSAAALAYKRALEAAAESGEAPRETASVHSNLSCSLLKLGHKEEALEAAQQCTELRAEWNKGWFRKGEALFALQRYDEAEEAYRQALELIFRSAQQMRNFIYFIGDATSREALVVDGAWDVEGILRYAETERVKLVGAVVTHYHFDHTGGMPPPPFDSLGIKVPGIKELATKHNLKVYANKHDSAVLRSKNGVPSDSIVELEDGASIEVGGVSLRFIHTPGHTPGSQCIHIERAPGHDEGVLISGDTLFIGSCGRLDLPDCSREAMYDSLQKLAVLPPDTRVYPGHDYGGAFTSIGKEKASGFLRPMSKEQWLATGGKR
ncbi:hypothetical protein CLOM_g8008 [Closterium sp. NIES-68]|nr:hypothetical protein CLOM_g8008 [Closterium sp. NIES-68]